MRNINLFSREIKGLVNIERDHFMEANGKQHLWDSYCSNRAICSLQRKLEGLCGETIAF